MQEYHTFMRDNCIPDYLLEETESSPELQLTSTMQS
jgi:hypothetical protein